MKKLIAISILCATSTFALAETNLYGGISYSMLDAELSGNGESEDTSPTALNFFGGATFNKNAAVELVLGKGLSDDDVGPSSYDLQFELDQFIAVYGVGILPVSEQLDLYGKVGLASVEYTDSDSDDSSGSGISYGVGGEFKFTQQIGASLEYVFYPDAEYDDYEVDIETNAINLRLNVHF